MIFKKKSKFSEIFLRFIVHITAIVSCLSLLSIVFYVLLNGISKINLEFLINSYSEISGAPKGILPMIINTFYIVFITMIISLPIGLGTAIYTTQYAKSKKFKRIISFSSDILAGIPSITFGLFGYSIFCSKFQLGTSILAGCLTMAICVLPTLVRTSEEALNNVPSDYKEASVALGATKLRTIFAVVIPSAMPEILTAISLCIGKILGESAVLLYTVGMSYSMPKGPISHIFASGRTLTLHLYQISRQANTSDSISICFATATVLMIIIALLNLVSCISFKGR